MLFASIDLARRIEAEDGVILTQGAHVARRHAPDAFARPICGGVASYAGPNAPFNKIAGLGFEPLDIDALEEVERDYAVRGCPVQVELATLADTDVARTLISRGYQLMGYENVLGYDLTRASTPSPTAVQIDRDTDLDAWVDLIVDGFASVDTQGVASHEDFPRDALDRCIRDMVACDGVARFTARLDGVPVGAASMRLSPDFAQLTGAATLPASRRRGVQSALLDHRLAIGAESGASLALITTLPGSKSQQNAHTRGFELLFARAMFVKPV